MSSVIEDFYLKQFPCLTQGHWQATGAMGFGSAWWFLPIYTNAEDITIRLQLVVLANSSRLTLRVDHAIHGMAIADIGDGRITDISGAVHPLLPSLIEEVREKYNQWASELNEGDRDA